MMKKPSPSPVDSEQKELHAISRNMAGHPSKRLGFDDGYWTSLDTDIVYSCREGLTGSLPREVYDDDWEYQKRSALHADVMAPLRRLLALEAAERDRLITLAAGAEQTPLAEQCRRHLERVKAIHAIMAAHWLTDSAD
jgi:hypothetical protein